MKSRTTVNETSKRGRNIKVHASPLARKSPAFWVCPRQSSNLKNWTKLSKIFKAVFVRMAVPLRSMAPTWHPRPIGQAAYKAGVAGMHKRQAVGQSYSVYTDGGLVQDGNCHPLDSRRHLYTPTYYGRKSANKPRQPVISPQSLVFLVAILLQARFVVFPIQVDTTLTKYEAGLTRGCGRGFLHWQAMRMYVLLKYSTHSTTNNPSGRFFVC